MKFKKVFFLWIFLIGIFFCVKTDAKMLKIQSSYFAFNPSNSQFYTEVFMPYSEENKTKLQLLNNNFDKIVNCLPEIIIVIDDDNFTENEKDFLIKYEKNLMKSGMLMYVDKFKGIKFEFFVKLDKLKNISKESGVLSEKDVLSFIVSTYVNQFKNIFFKKPLDKTKQFNAIKQRECTYNFLLEYLNFDNKNSAKCGANFLFLFG